MLSNRILTTHCAGKSAEQKFLNGQPIISNRQLRDICDFIRRLLIINTGHWGAGGGGGGGGGARAGRSNHELRIA